MAMNKLKKQAKNVSQNIKILKHVSLIDFNLIIPEFGPGSTSRGFTGINPKIIKFMFFSSKDKNEKQNKAYKSSTAFFKQLQENTQLGKKVIKKKRAGDSNEKSSKKLKL
jgi:hypothetical protein